MPAMILSATSVGVEGHLVRVEGDRNPGLPKFLVVGLPDTAVQESRERVRSAIRAAGFFFPRGHITVNLAPADLRKAGPGFDLPIALALLVQTKQLDPAVCAEKVFAGELGLDGTLRPIRGALLIARAARTEQAKLCVVPKHNGPEAALVDGIQVVAPQTLHQLIQYLRGEITIAPPTPIPPAHHLPTDQDFALVRGQAQAKRALEIAAAGGHNVLLVGPPGSGKTMLARCLPTILPPLTEPEALEVTAIHSVGGVLPADTPLQLRRPFRTPHHTTSTVALVGGGSLPKPGEVSLAHHGVLYLDELPEFPRQALEALRQPLEDGVVTVARAAQSLQFPARCTLVASQNPCPCGFRGDSQRQCVCSSRQLLQYERKVSGPLLDRIDLHIHVPRQTFSTLRIDGVRSEDSASIAQRVAKARKLQQTRFASVGLCTNAQMQQAQVAAYCQVDAVSHTLLQQAVDSLHLSARGYVRVLKVARTIADLAASESIQMQHVAEALQYRSQPVFG